MKAVICPVCSGAGEAGDWLKGLPLTTKSKCWGCNGKGWVEVSESDYNPIRELKWDYPETCSPGLYQDKCPSCGGDRNGSPLTGCPKGFHYGTYCSPEYLNDPHYYQEVV